VNAEAIDVRLKQEQGKIASDLAMMPYNARARIQQGPDASKAEQVYISDDSVSDIPAHAW
jgi:hypothetical protein